MGFWDHWRWWIVEAFVFANISFLAVDIFIAHSINAFGHSAEWIPFGFSIIAPFLLMADLIIHRKTPGQGPHLLGKLVGLLSILIGIAGVLFHLKSQFFQAQSLKSLVYTAPFVAPLAYSGLGFILLMNRMVCEKTMEWGQWLVLLGLGGFVGNFILALCDHAQNGFFVQSEWIPVIASALAIGFLIPSLCGKNLAPFIHLCLIIMALQVLIGFLGFYFHAQAVMHGPSPQLFENILYVAPILAPLLFANLAILCALGLYDLRQKL